MSAKEQRNDSNTDPIKTMLVENTGRHFLDSGGAYGRNFEENQQTPPWEQPRIQVGDGYCVKNVYHHLVEADLERDSEVERIESEFYEWATTGEMERESWLTCMEEYAEMLHDEAGSGFYNSVFTHNTYNNEFGSLTQIIQYTQFKKNGESFVFLQIHGGCDVRGGYTKPRLFKQWSHDSLMTHEFEFSCECSTRYESCIAYDNEQYEYDRENNEVRCTECGDDVLVH